MIRHLGRTILCIFSLALLLSSMVVHAEPSGVIVALRAEYLRLRNNDPVGVSAQYKDAWTTLSKRLDTALAKQPNGDGVSRLRMYAADTEMRLFHVTGDDRYATAASRVLMPLVSSPRSGGADYGDAVVMLGDIELASGGSRDKAQEFYAQALRTEGPSRVKAIERLQGVKNGTFNDLIPSDDLATPRFVQRALLKKRGSVGPVVIDPGHGGYDAGAIGLYGLEEKEVTLDIAKRVRSILSERYGIPALLTREGDEFVPLARRTAYANSKDAVAFVSLHINASAGHDGAGLESYYLDNANDAASRKLAERENGVSSGGGVDDISFMVSDLIQSGKLEDSIRLTRTLDAALRINVAPSYRQARFLGVKKGPFFVLVGAHMPCSLVEMFFVDNSQDAAKLAQSQFRAELAAGIAQGIARFVRGDADLLQAPQLRLASHQGTNATRKKKGVVR